MVLHRLLENARVDSRNIEERKLPSGRINRGGRESMERQRPDYVTNERGEGKTSNSGMRLG